MPKLLGLYDQFKDIDKISGEDVLKWLSGKRELHLVENFIGNRILYPQTLPVTKEDLNLDLALLKEIVKRNPTYFYDATSKKIVLTAEIIARFGNFSNLIIALMDCLNLEGLTYIYLKSLNDISLQGSVVSFAKFIKEDPVTVGFNGTFTKFKLGQIIFKPFTDKHIRIVVDGMQELVASGGNLGLIIDLRKSIF